jgi:hypothetical protein
MRKGKSFILESTGEFSASVIKRATIRICRILLVVLPIIISNCANFFMMRKTPEFKSAIAISLRELTSQHNTSQLNDSAKKNMNNLYGMNRILGYVLDGKNRDIIVIGARMEPSPDLLLDDFVMMLRNAINGQEPPGCSIDPRPQEMESLHALRKKMDKWQDPFLWEVMMSKWKKNPGFESTRVLGVEKNSNVAKVMIDADYLMKKITDGSHRIKVKGFKSYMDFTLEDHMDKMAKKQELPAQEIFERFWFYPTKSSFLFNENAIYFRKSSVKLLTEEMHWSEEGTQTGTGRPHPVAERFVTLFSDKYQDISNVEPIDA